MSVVSDIVQTWTDPKGVIRAKTVLPREDRALATVMGACLLLFVGEWPSMARNVAADPSVPFEARVGGGLMAVIFVMPLVLYGIAWIGRLIAGAFGGRASGYAARMALFQALLAMTPLALIYGLARGVQGPGPAATITGLAALAGFLWMWLTMLWTVEREGPGHV
jgi:hypothetical protein